MHESLLFSVPSLALFDGMKFVQVVSMVGDSSIPVMELRIHAEWHIMEGSELCEYGGGFEGRRRLEAWFVQKHEQKFGEALVCFVESFLIFFHGIVRELCDGEPVLQGLCGPDGARMGLVCRFVVGRRRLSMQMVGCAEKLCILE